jgi:hypothetical protein
VRVCKEIVENLIRHTPTTGGTAIDANGNIYLSDVILKITPASNVTTLIQDSRLDWADALWTDRQGYLWIPAAQIDQIAPFQGGVSRVMFSVTIYKLQIGAQPSIKLCPVAGQISSS